MEIEAAREKQIGFLDIARSPPSPLSYLSVLLLGVHGAMSETGQRQAGETDDGSALSWRRAGGGGGWELL